MILHVNSISEVSGNKVRIAFQALQEVVNQEETKIPPSMVRQSQYPGYAMAGSLNVTLDAEAAKDFSMGAEFNLVKK